MNRRQMFVTTSRLLLGLAGLVAMRRLPDEPIEVSRVAQARELHLTVHSEPSKGFQDAVVKAVVDDVRRNGPTREVIAGMVKG